MTRQHKIPQIHRRCYLSWERKPRQEGNPQEVIEYFDKTIRIIPKHSAAWFAKGVAYKKLRAYRNATACFLRVVETDPQNGHAYYEMAQILEKTGNNEESIRCYIETVRCDPSHTDAIYRLGNLLMEGGDYKNAIAYFDRVLDISPESSVAWFAKGKALQKRGQQKDAERCFERHQNWQQGRNMRGVQMSKPRLFGRHNLRPLTRIPAGIQ